MSFLGWLFAVVLILLIVEIIKLVRVFNNRPAIIHEQLDVPPFISLIIPVRNEEKRIVSCLESLSRQDYPTSLFEVIVVNDHSEDETRQIVESFTSNNPGFRLLDAPVLPGEWSGKSHACHVGSMEARGDYLCFIDADVTATEALLRDTAAYAVKHELDVLSLVPYQETKSLIEKILLLPLLIMIGASLPKKQLVLNGQFLMFRRKTYQEIGGHTIVKKTVAEDLDFAAFFMDTSYKTQFLFAEHLLSCRMYDNYHALSAGVSKMIVRLMANNSFRSSWLSLKYSIFSLFSLVAIILILFNTSVSRSVYEKSVIISVPVLALAIATGIAGYFHIGYWYAPLLPLGWLFQPLFFFQSLRGKYRHYYKWKGRKVYHS